MGNDNQVTSDDLQGDQPLEEEQVQEVPAETTEEESEAQPQEQQQEEQPKYVTQQDLDRLADEIIRRTRQSNKDRDTRIQAQLDGMRETLKQSGLTMNEQQESALRQTIEQQIDNADEQTDQPSPEFQQQVEFVYEQIQSVFADTGTDVVQGDPEFKIIEAALNDRKGSLAKTLLAANQAATQKANRIASQREKATARVGSSGGGKQPPAKRSLSPEDKISQGLKQQSFRQGPRE